MVVRRPSVFTPPASMSFKPGTGPGFKPGTGSQYNGMGLNSGSQETQPPIAMLNMMSKMQAELRGEIRGLGKHIIDFRGDVGSWQTQHNQILQTLTAHFGIDSPGTSPVHRPKAFSPVEDASEEYELDQATASSPGPPKSRPVTASNSPDNRTKSLSLPHCFEDDDKFDETAPFPTKLDEMGSFFPTRASPPENSFLPRASAASTDFLPQASAASTDTNGPRSRPSGSPLRMVVREFALDRTWQKAPKNIAKHKPGPGLERKATSNNLEDAMVAGHSERPGLLEHHGSGLLDQGDGVSKPRCMLAPSDRLRLLWDMLMGLNLTIEALLTPFTMCFQPAENDAATVGRCISTLFWTFDLILTFNTGIHQHGHIVMDRPTVAFHYVKTWLSFDLLLIILDAMTIMGVKSKNTSGLKMLRLIRAVRLLRLLKLRHLLQNLTSMLHSDTMLLVCAIGSRLLSIIGITHIMACGWYLCATYKDVETHRNWVKAFQVDEEPLFTKYIMSLHWSVSQIHGSMEVSPQNPVERSYAIVGLMLSLFVMAVLVGNFANLLANLWSTKNYKTRQLWLLRRYMSQLEVSCNVATKIDTYVQHVLTTELGVVDSSSIDILKYLSQPLADELKADSYSKFMNTHPLFRFCSYNGGDLNVTIVDALSMRYLSGGDFAFSCGERLTDLIFLVDGDGTYYLRDEEDGLNPQTLCECGAVFPDDLLFCQQCNAQRKGQQPTIVEVIGEDDRHSGVLPASWGSSNDPKGIQSNDPKGVVVAAKTVWIGEPALWTSEWHCRGDLEVKEACQAAFIDAKIFKEKARNDSSLWHKMAAYSGAYLKQLNAATTDLSDLLMQNVQPEEVLMDSGLSLPEEDDLGSRLFGGMRRTQGRRAAVRAVIT